MLILDWLFIYNAEHNQSLVRTGVKISFTSRNFHFMCFYIIQMLEPKLNIHLREVICSKLLYNLDNLLVQIVRFIYKTVTVATLHFTNLFWWDTIAEHFKKVYLKIFNFTDISFGLAIEWHFTHKIKKLQALLKINLAKILKMARANSFAS